MQTDIERVQEWLFDQEQCWICGWKIGDQWRVPDHKIDPHHMERRAHSGSTARDAPYNLFAACSDCHHQRIHRLNMREALQLAYKWVKDPCGFEELEDLIKTWLRIRDPMLKAPKRVSVDDCLMYLSHDELHILPCACGREDCPSWGVCHYAPCGRPTRPAKRNESNGVRCGEPRLYCSIKCSNADKGLSNKIHKEWFGG